MNYAEIEAELDNLETDELRRLAVKSWTAFVQKAGRANGINECDESDPHLLAALDDAVRRADAAPGQGHTGPELRTRMSEWTTK